MNSELMYLFSLLVAFIFFLNSCVSHTHMCGGCVCLQFLYSLQHSGLAQVSTIARNNTTHASSLSIVKKRQCQQIGQII